MTDPNRPPIPSPFESPVSTEVAIHNDWSLAPKIVKHWAYPLTWLAIIITPLAFLANFVGEETASYSYRTKLIGGLLYGIGWSISIWHNRALKKGVPIAWNVQIVSSVLGLCAVPLGTFINIYILTHWFKPETKAWFGQR